MAALDKRAALLKMQAASSKLISICTSAYNGRIEAADEIPEILSRLNELYAAGFTAEQEPKEETSDKPVKTPVNKPVFKMEDPSHEPDENWQSTMKKTLDDWDRFVKSPAAASAVAKMTADEAAKQAANIHVDKVVLDSNTPEETDGIAAEDTRPLSLSALAIAEQKKMAELSKTDKKPVFKPVKIKGEKLPDDPDSKLSEGSATVREDFTGRTKSSAQTENEQRCSGNTHKLRPEAKAFIAVLFLAGLLGASKVASNGVNVSAASPTATPEIVETAVPEPVETAVPVSTPTPTPVPSTTPEVTEEPEETAETESAETDESSEAEEKTEKRKEPLGTSGRLYFDNGWSVALNYADSYDTDTAQTLADAWDSACYMEDSGKIMIADHATQGFDVILDCPEGTRATMVDADGNETRIICKTVYKDAYWEDGFTHLPDGRGIWGASDGSIGMQTSTNSDGTQVFISYWDPVEE